MEAAYALIGYSPTEGAAKLVCRTSLSPATSVTGLKPAKSGLPCTSYIFPGLLVNVIARVELLDSQLVPVISIESQCAATIYGKAIKTHKQNLAFIYSLKG